MLPVSLDDPFLIAPSVFSNVYFMQMTGTKIRITSLFLKVTCDRSVVFFGFSGFLHQLKLTATEVLLKVALNIIK
jgi:hypothetical protein